MSSFEMKGFDELKKKLKDLNDRAQGLHGEHSIPLKELFPPEFLSQHTQFESIEDMFKKSGFKVASADDFKNIPDAEWDAFIQNHTQFPSWKAMLKKASEEWTVRKLGLK